MEILINSELVKNARKNKNWTQQHLAQLCGLSLRTIQRIEKSGSGSQESLASLSSSLELPIEQLRSNISNKPKAELVDILGVDVRLCLALILINCLAFGSVFLPDNFENILYSNYFLYILLAILAYKNKWFDLQFMIIAIAVPTFTLLFHILVGR